MAKMTNGSVLSTILHLLTRESALKEVAAVMQAEPAAAPKRRGNPAGLVKARAAKQAKAQARKAQAAEHRQPARRQTATKAGTHGGTHEPLCEGASLFAGVNRAGRPYAGLRFGEEYGASCVVRRRHLPVWRRVLAPKAYATLEAFVDLYGG